RPLTSPLFPYTTLFRSDAVIQRAIVAWSRVKTLRATFEQTVTNPITGSALASKGELQQRKPGRLAITFSEPEGDRIVVDGTNVRSEERRVGKGGEARGT